MNKIDQNRIHIARRGKKHMAEVAAMSPEARARVAQEEQAQIDAFMREKGVTQCSASWAGGSQFSAMLGTDL